MKPANIAALSGPGTRRASAEAVGSAMGDWVSEAFRVIPPAKALEVCRKREGQEEGRFAANREVLMELVVVRNRAEAIWQRQQGQTAHIQPNEARKALERAVHKAKMTDIAEKSRAAWVGRSTGHVATALPFHARVGLELKLRVRRHGLLQRLQAGLHNEEKEGRAERAPRLDATGAGHRHRLAVEV